MIANNIFDNPIRLSVTSSVLDLRCRNKMASEHGKVIEVKRNQEFVYFMNNEKSKTIIITFPDVKAEYPYYWLRDNCRCEKCYNKVTKQMNKHLIEIPWDIKPLEVNKQNDLLEVVWEDKHISTYSSLLLYDSYYGNWKRSQVFNSILWAGKNVPNDIVYVDRDEFLNSEESLRKFLDSLIKFGVAFVDNVEPNIEDTERVIRRVGQPQRTLFGDIWEFTSNYERADTAYTNEALHPHTDCTYLVESPGLQVLHCLKHDGTEGNTIVVDGFYVAELLKKNNPSYYKTLTDELQPAKYEESGWHQYHCDPVIKINSLTKQVSQIRYNINDRASYCISEDPKKIMDMYEALCEFGKLCDSRDILWVFKLKPGRVFFFDNWRMLHGRTSFTGHRVMGGAYIARDEWLSAARVLGLIQ